jgi:class 3 adenylate cyclase/tetratricopeptide (TPR) repeat protein
MKGERVKRRLTAILAADVVGYSRLIGDDDEGTQARLKAHHRQLISPKVRQYGGRIVDNAGDGFLAAFGSVVDSLRCAVDVQRAMIERNAQIAPAQRIEFRMGINVGDIVVDGRRVYGDGVNVAARLEALSEAGGICVSERVWEDAQGKFDIAFEDAGEQHLKNISRSVRIFHVRVTPPATFTSQPLVILGKIFAVSNIPIRVPEHFLGRDDALVAIEAALNRYEGRVAITALHGLRGVGKTTLAAAFAERHRRNYRATWWIRAQTETTMRTDLVSLAIRLGWVPAAEKEEPAIAVVMERLRHEGEGILLIYDNAIDADAVKPYLSRGGAAKVLVTSNAHAWRGVAVPVEIRLWPKEIGANYLIVRTGRVAERAAAEALSEALGGLPLAHEQAAAYCERLDISLAEYARRFAATPTRLLDDERDAPAEYHDGLTVAKTFALAIEEAAKLHPAAEPLIVHAALLAPEPIPLFLFTEAREKFGEPLATMLADDGLDEALAALRTFALLSRETIADERDPALTTETVRLHRLVRQVAAARREGDSLKNARRVLIEATAAVFPRFIYNDPQTWPRTRRLDGLALPLVDGDALLPRGAEEAASHLLNQLATYRYRVLGAYPQARPLAERALAIRERVLGPNHEKTAWSLIFLARLHQAQGDLLAARPLHERALGILEKVCGPEHPHTARGLNNLGQVLQLQGDLVAARLLYERALGIFERQLGPEHPDTSWALDNIADVLYRLGDLAGALPFQERALSIREKVLGPDHPDTAESLEGLASILRDQGEVSKALPLQDRALAIREKAFGHEHPSTARSLNNLGLLLQRQGDFASAGLLYKRALATLEITAPEHPNTNRLRCNLACLLVAAGSAGEALAFAEAALAGHERVLGKNHRWTRDSAKTTADALAALGRAGESLMLRNSYDLADTRPAG